MEGESIQSLKDPAVLAVAAGQPVLHLEGLVPRNHGGRGKGSASNCFIAKAIPVAHGGALEVDSSLGATTFRMVLPRGVGAG